MVYEFPGNTSGTMMKMWSGTRFSVVGKIIADSGTIFNPVMGTYNLDGEKNTENDEVHVNPDFEGITVNMKLVIKNDTLIQIWPVNEIGEPVENANIEKYILIII